VDQGFQHVCLIVDDEPAIRAYLRAVLEKEQIRCMEAEDAVEALRLVKRLEGAVDLVLTDVVMPGDMNGIDLAHWLSTTYPKVSVVLMSGYADEEHVLRAASVFKLVQKPFTVDRILDAVRPAIEA
jgi:DNA-binding NtrC family response regulator